MTSQEKFEQLLTEQYNRVFSTIPLPGVVTGQQFQVRTSGPNEFDKFKQELGIKWDDFLNKLKIKRIDHPKKPVPKGHIRIKDPHWRKHNRFIEISEDEALRYMTLGFPI